jgi:hypothetical protein
MKISDASSHAGQGLMTLRNIFARDMAADFTALSMMR